MRKARFITLLAMTACTAMAGVAAISVSHPWIRLLPGNLPLAGYFDLRNTGPSALSLIGASSAEFARIELHRSMQMQGMDRMVPVGHVTVPGGAQVRFAPGGYHLMLFDPRQPLEVGEHVTIVLKFAGGRSQAVTFLVRPAAAR